MTGGRLDPVASLVAPPDPRSSWDVAPLGTLAREVRLDELVVRVLAPNPSRMALDGTNTYLIGAPGSSEWAIVDPGPPDPEHLARVEGWLRRSDAECRWILVTHHHIDHAEAATAWATRFGATVAAGSAAVAGPGGKLLSPDDRIQVGATSVRAVATPGHCSDHFAFRLASGAVLVGDHILGRGTSVVTYPEGDLLAYLDSLRRTLDLGPAALYPGHGPAMTDDPTAVIDYYIAHRRYRENQIMAAFSDGPAEVPGLVRRIYHDVDERLWPYAEQSTRAALAKLAAEGRLEFDGADSARLV